MDVSDSLDPSQADIHTRLAAIVESSDDAIVSKTLEGVIRTWNKGADAFSGGLPTK